MGFCILIYPVFTIAIYRSLEVKMLYSVVVKIHWNFWANEESPSPLRIRVADKTSKP